VLDFLPDTGSPGSRPAPGLTTAGSSDRAAANCHDDTSKLVCDRLMKYHTFRYSSPRMRKNSSRRAAFLELALKDAIITSPARGINL